MLTNNDIKRIVEATIAAGKEVFVTKEEFALAFGELRNEFNQLQASVDNAYKILIRHDDELKIINHRLLN
jgi:hypothetical protein